MKNRLLNSVDQPPSIFLVVILLGMNKPGPWKCPWTSSRKRTKNENTAMGEQAIEVGRKLKLRLWDQTGKDRVESSERRCKDSPYSSGWLVSSYPIRHAFPQHISEKVSVEWVLNKGKSSCHIAWRNGSMVVHLTNTAMILDLKGFQINQKLFLSTSEYYYCYQRRKWSMPDILLSWEARWPHG